MYSSFRYFHLIPPGIRAGEGEQLQIYSLPSFNLSSSVIGCFLPSEIQLAFIVSKTCSAPSHWSVGVSYVCAACMCISLPLPLF